MSNDAAILQAIQSLTDEVRCGFERTNGHMQSLEHRVDKVEKDILRLKTVWTTLVTLVGIGFSVLRDYVFPHR